MPSTLVDEDGAITDELVHVLEAVFDRFAATPREPVAPPISDIDLSDMKNAKAGQKALTRAQLNAFARETNDNQICEYFDCVLVNVGDAKEPALTPMGFIQLYELQTGAEEYETRKDLATWGYNDDLEFVGPGKVPIPPKPVGKEDGGEDDEAPPEATAGVDA
ncbi:hypothetical protein OIV83_001329 [Microbotryomycetes sp. JL201]|nr:hypothetical protein OIV83_001329 [Microbotryomycetes sp. JL201]